MEDIRTQDDQGYFFRGGYYPVQLWNRKAAVLWANISKVSYKKRSFLNCPKTQQGFFLKAQGSVIRKELEILQPDVCIFLTGPNYDPIALECFPHVSFDRLTPEIPTRQLAIVTNLKVPAYRTYHPRYLLMGRKSHYLDIIRHEIFGK